MVLIHKNQTRREAYQVAADTLHRVGLPKHLLHRDVYPHEISGGQQQRVLIAKGFVAKPNLIIADEPTTSLDVTTQAGILKLLEDLVKSEDVSLLLITHDLAVVAETCERVIVMYGGMVQEIAPVEELFSNPLHPYTHGLLKSIPNPNQANENNRLEIIEGMVPNILSMPKGCKFCTRCELKEDICESDEPPLIDIGNNHFIRCHLVQTNGDIV